MRAEVRDERERRQRHEREALRNKEAVHRLFAKQRLDGGRDGGRDALRESSPLRRSRDTRSPMLSISPNRIREARSRRDRAEIVIRPRCARDRRARAEIGPRRARDRRGGAQRGLGLNGRAQLQPE